MTYYEDTDNLAYVKERLTLLESRVREVEYVTGIRSIQRVRREHQVDQTDVIEDMNRRLRELSRRVDYLVLLTNSTALTYSNMVFHASEDDVQVIVFKICRLEMAVHDLEGHTGISTHNFLCNDECVPITPALKKVIDREVGRFSFHSTGTQSIISVNGYYKCQTTEDTGFTLVVMQHPQTYTANVILDPPSGRKYFRMFLYDVFETLERNLYDDIKQVIPHHILGVRERRKSDS